MNKCPLGLKKHEDCAFYRRGIRIMRDESQVPFEECAINIIADTVENMVHRQIGIQAEINKVANNLDKLLSLFAMILRDKYNADALQIQSKEKD